MQRADLCGRELLMNVDCGRGHCISFLEHLALQCVGRTGLGRAALRDFCSYLLEPEIIGQPAPRLMHRLAIRRDTRRLMVELADQGILNPEHRVAVEVGTIGSEHMRDKHLVVRSADQEMDVRRAKRMPSAGLEHFTDRPVVWYRIESRHNRPEIKTAARVSTK